MPKYVPYRKIKEEYEVGSETIRNWAKKGLINYKIIQNKCRKTWLYDIESIGRYIKQGERKQKTCRVLYARVSSKKQEPDLKRQIQLLQEQYPEDEFISDIGSGLNFKRSGFSKLVERICRGEISEIVVTYKDRLARFGYELFEQVCEENGCRIVVLSKKLYFGDVNKTETEELQEDLLSIVNVFVARRNGKRAGELRKARTKQHEKNKTVSKSNPERKIKPNISRE